MSEFPPALPHGDLKEIFPDVFFVTGAMQTMLMGAPWRFSRNMTVVRDGADLTVINSVRLDEAGLAQLDALGRVANVVKIGSLHGRDDAFYKSRFGATLWSLPDMQHEHGLTTDKALTPDGETPFAGCRVFEFRTTKMPECILRVDREGGILIACDSLQNWLAPNELFSDESRQLMADMGFFEPANLGPLWRQVSEPRSEDFVRLLELPFRHALCGHGTPLRDTAKEEYGATIRRIFGIQQ